MATTLVVLALTAAAFGAAAIAKPPPVKPVEVPYTSQLFYTYPGELGHNQAWWVWFELDRGYDVEFTVIPTNNNVWLHVDDYAVQQLDDGRLRHAIHVKHLEYLSTGFKVRARIYSLGIASDDVALAASSAQMKAGKKLPN